MAKPELRLKGFEGEWLIKPLQSFSKKVTRKNGNLEYRITLTNSAERGVINQLDFFDHDISNGDNIKGYYVVEPDDFVYNPRVSVTAPVGPINRSLLNYIGVMSPLYYVFKVSNINKDYLSYFFKTRKWHKYMRDNGNNGARFDRISMSDDVFGLMPISYPKDSKEQESIADYFKSLDSMIQVTTKKIASLKQMKSASLISMFPQAGETKPRVRFKGFEGEWEDVSFKDISYLAGTKNRENLTLESYSISNEFGFIPQNEQFENGGTMSNADKRMYYIVTPDSFAYNPARINVGSIGYDDLDKDVIVSSLYVVFKTDDDTYNPFLNYWFKTPMFKKMIELYQEGGVRLYFFYDKLCNCHFRRPSLKEQQRIASYFRSLDKQIALQEQRLEKLKQIKSACLDKMFV